MSDESHPELVHWTNLTPAQQAFAAWRRAVTKRHLAQQEEIDREADLNAACKAYDAQNSL